MKKITFLLFALLFSFVGYSQFPTPGIEGFENTTGPALATPVATSPWNLGTGAPNNQWAVFDNGVPAPAAGQIRWTRAISNFYAGTQAAFINRKQIGINNTSADYLATPLVTVPLNGQLLFYTRTSLNNTDAVNYKIKVNTITTIGSQTTLANYVNTVQTWNQTTIAATYNIYELKTVDLSAYAGQQIYIAFVRESTQATNAPGGNGWYIDEVKLVQQCIAPTSGSLTATNITTTSADLSWGANGNTSWEIEVVPATGTPIGVGVTYNGVLPYPATGLTPATGYVYYVRSKCSSSDSAWVGPFNFNTLTPGLTCPTAIIIPPALPYSTTDTTANYSDTTDVTQPTACAGTATNYMTGNDVFYSYTATTTGAISITMTPGDATATNSGIFVYNGCSNVGLTCLAGVANATAGVRTITSLNVTAGQTYIIVLSSTSTTQTYPYTLLIQQLNCAQPTDLAVPAVTPTGAQLSWICPTSLSWQYVVQPAGGTVPTAPGTTTTSSTNSMVSGLNPDTAYQYWVRADCDGGGTTFSAWAGPFLFTTAVAPPECGGLFIDAGGQAGNYPNNITETLGTTVINPVTPGDQVTVTFTSFNTQANTDLLKVYDGTSASGTLLATYSGTPTVPFSITSSSPSGSLTFVFTSNDTTQAAGWVANVTCVPAPSCQKPILLNIPFGTVVYDSVTLAWTQPANPDGNAPSAWDIIALPCGSPAPTAGTPADVMVFENPYIYTGLSPLTCYDFYIRAVCENNSDWVGPVNATTPIAPPICGGNFVDTGGPTGNYANNANYSSTICPINPGEQVTVTFTSFNTQLNTDILEVYDGNSATGTLLGTYSGPTLPPVITSSSPDGCLTFVFTSNATTVGAGWLANVTCAPAPPCQKPILLNAPTATVLYNSVSLAWTQPANPDTTIPNAWEVIALPCGSTVPSATATGVITAETNPFTVTGLTPLTCYDFYVRAVCSPTSSSSWTGPLSATTPIAPPICGGNFVDPGGIAGNYANNIVASTTTINPVNPGDQVTVTFTAFNTQLNTDILQVYDGIGTSGTLLATYSGPFIPQPITSSSPDGSLTFVFNSNGSTVASGWLATVTCAPAPPCQKPTVLNIPTATVLYNSVTVAWTQPANPDTTIPNAWEVIALPCGSPAPSANATGVITAATNPFTVTGLIPLTCYDFYVRAVCSASSSSSWSGPVSATTPIAPPICGGNFVDPGGIAGLYPNNITALNGGTTIINPVNPGDQVTVTFSEFNTQLNTDILQVYDGIGTTGTLLATYSGTTIPQPITSSTPNGALTFLFTSNGTTNAAGWLASVTCAPAPPCQKPIVLTTPTATVLYNSIALGWTQPANPDGSVPSAWEVIALPCGSPAPNETTTGVITAATNPITISGLNSATCYDFYVRAVCSSTSSSSWSGPKTTYTATCSVPTLVLTGSNSLTTALVSWTETGSATQWEVLYLPQGSPAPGSGSIGTIVNTNPTTISGLTVGSFYDVYVRSICTSNSQSGWSTPSNLYVNPPLPECAGVNLNLTTTSPGQINICPDNNCVNLTATYTDSRDTSSYEVFSAPYTPAFPFTGGTQLFVNQDDVWSGDLIIPFKFCFYGVSYDKLNVGANGVVTFNTQAAGSNCPWAYTAQIPSTTFPIRNAIYAPYQDTNPSITTPPAQPNINYQVLGVAPCRVFVINYSKLAQFSCLNSVGLQTSQIVLYETSNVIDIYVKDRTSCTTWNSGSGVIGIQNAAGTNAVVPPGRNTGTWEAHDEAWRFLPNGNSNVTFQWLQNGAPFTPNLTANVCITQDTNMTAQATYTACDGTQVIKSENVLLHLLTPVTPTFTQILPLCQGVTTPVLPTTSNNIVGITGTWSPATIDTSVTGTVTYTFTPTAGQCALPTTMNVTVNNSVIPIFTTPAPICSGAVAPLLSNFSSNIPQITGVWSPAIVSNMASGTYTFQPDAGQCAANTTLDVTVNTNCSLGSNASAVWLSNCSTSNFFNTVGSGTDIIGPVDNVFQNSNLGTYVQNSNLLILRGAEVKTFKSATANICSARLNYRVYPATTTPTAFQVMGLPLFDNCSGGTFPTGGPCNTGDQKWNRVVADGTTNPYSPVNLTTYPPGNYVIQVYYDLNGSTTNPAGCDENILIDNNGAYFTANFTIQAQPIYSSSNPTTCSSTNGFITISDLAPSTTYEISYQQGTTIVGPVNFTSNNSGYIVISGLNAATYSNFSITLNGCIYPYVTPIILVDPIKPTVTVNNSTVCAGQNATVTATPGTAGTYSYAWTIPAGAIPPGNVNTFTTAVGGVYSVIITNTITGCSSESGSGTITVNALPTVTVTSPTACQGQTATVTATPTPTGIYSYIWICPAGVTNPGNVATFNATVSGNYSVIATNTVTGCSSISVSSTVSINPIPIVSVNSPILCGGIATVTATVSTPGTYTYTWTVPAGVTNPGNVASFTTNVSGVYTVVVNNVSSLCNVDFDAPIGVPTAGSLFVNQSNFSCWRTTATDGMIEVWSSGFQSTPSYSGTQFIELNANQVSTLYQDMSVLPGSTINVSFAHRGRFSGTDVMRVEIGPIGGPYVSLGQFSATPAAWVYNTVPYTFPSNGISNYSLRFVSVSAGTANLTVGNFIDAISLTTANCPASASGTVTINSVITPTFAPIASICLGDTAPLPTLPSTSLNGILGSWTPAVIDPTLVGSTPYIFNPSPGQCSEPKTIYVTVNSVPTPTVVVVTQPTCVTPTGTVEVTAPISSLGAQTPTDLFISEATDSNSGSLSYVELYNGTGASINLSNYSIKTSNNGNAYGFTLPLNNVNIASGSTYVVALGNDSSCSSIFGGDGSLGVQSSGSGSVNFTVNGNDHYGLFNGTTLIDSWGTFGDNNWAPSSIGNEGADFRRKSTISPLPNTTYNNNDWDILDYAGSSICANNDYSNIGLYTLNTTTTNYQYSVDGGAYQSSPIFSGLNPGIHTITVQDVLTGCISVAVPVTLSSPILNPSVSFFNYTTPVCIDVASTLTPDTSAAGFTPGGTYSVTPATGLSVNASTGVVNLATAIPGTYQLTYAVTANLALCQDASSTTTPLVINAKPTVSVNSPTVCFGQNAVITATPDTTGTYSYVWTVPAGVTNPGNVATFTTPIAGSYCVVITNTTTGCSSISVCGTVTINSVPTVTVNSPTVCAGINATVTATPGISGSYTYTWTVPIGVTNPGNVATFNATVSGTYTVTITSTSGCISTVASSIVTINTNPTVTVNSPTVCAGQNAVVTASPGSIGTYSYLWTVPSGTTNPGNVATFTATISGIYSVVITNTLTGCSSISASGTAVINTVPTVSVTSPTVCAGINAVVTATPGAIGTYTYNWTVPTGVTNPGNVATFNASVSGTYSVTITNSGGCTSTIATSTVIIKPIPVVSVSSATICQGATATITATPSTPGTYTYIWNGPVGSNPGTSATFDTTIAGTYSVVITNTVTGCSSPSTSGTVTFNPAFDFTLFGECIDNKYTLEVIPTNNSFDVNTATFNWTLTPQPAVSIGSNATFDATTYIGGLT
ncbi:CUB domain-containing protein, partial [Flavobacterium sp.]|uniref:CUB domain-containing protein n=1 Tax=Flavobacterium sp. TaxID=239 RepID=UPI003BC775FF